MALPDVLLLDAADGRFWFVEVVVSGGEINERRRAELEAWRPVARRPFGELAWGTYAWLADEPHAVVTLGGLADLLE